METALWTALRALEERAALCDRVAERIRKRGASGTADRFDSQASEARGRAAVLRQFLLSETRTNAEPSPDVEAAYPPDEGEGHHR
jgi:two-component system chemotaxis response regulator CheB